MKYYGESHSVQSVDFFLVCVEFFETELCVPFLLQVDGSEYGFCEFLVTFLGRSIAAGNDDNRYLSKIACPANIDTEQYIKAVLFPRLVNWVNSNGVFFNGCAVFKSECLRHFMFPHGIVSNMEDVVASDKFVVDYANGFISWLTKYSLEEIQLILLHVCPGRVCSKTHTIDPEFLNHFLCSLPYAEFRFNLAVLVPFGVALPYVLRCKHATVVTVFVFCQVGYSFFKAWLIVVGIFLPYSACNVCGETYKFFPLDARPYSLLKCGCKTKGGHSKRTNIKMQSVLRGTSFDILRVLLVFFLYCLFVEM